MGIQCILSSAHRKTLKRVDLTCFSLRSTVLLLKLLLLCQRNLISLNIMQNALLLFFLDRYVQLLLVIMNQLLNVHIGLLLLLHRV